ncbi:hypothetical protein WG66_010661 [Moniliophthora roreri]|nr:hypothetical protein WG66_010661 [Moniliophthora roreri]
MAKDFWSNGCRTLCRDDGVKKSKDCCTLYYKDGILIYMFHGD